MSDLKRQLIKLGSTNPELRPHLRVVLDTLSLSKVSMDTFTEKYLKEDIQDVLEKANLWRGYRWKQEVGFRGHTDPTTEVTFSTRINGEHFSVSLDSHDNVQIYQGTRLHTFYKLEPALRWLRQEFSKTANLKGYSQSGGSPKTPEDRRIADSIKKILERAGIWRGNRWEYFLNYQDGFDPTTTIGYSTYDMGDYFAISFETFGPNAGDVVVNQGGEYEYFPNLNAAQRWLQQNFG